LNIQERIQSDKNKCEEQFEQHRFKILCELNNVARAFHDGEYPEEPRFENDMLNGIRRMQVAVNSLAMVAGALCAIGSIERVIEGDEQ